MPTEAIQPILQAGGIVAAILLIGFFAIFALPTKHPKIQTTLACVFVICILLIAGLYAYDQTIGKRQTTATPGPELPRQGEGKPEEKTEKKSAATAGTIEIPPTTPPPIKGIDESHFEIQPGITVVFSTNMGSFNDRENYIKVFQNSRLICEWNNRPSLPRETYAVDHRITNTDSERSTYRIESRHKNRRPDSPPRSGEPDVFHDNSQKLASPSSSSQIDYEFHDGINPFYLGIKEVR